MLAGSSEAMTKVQKAPIVARKKILDWIRPFSVGSIGLTSDRGVLGPLEPLADGAARSDPLAESAPGEVVGDLLRRDLKAEEGVHAGEVAAEGGRAGRVHHSGGAGGAPQLEGALDVQAALRVAAGAAVVEQVLEHPVLADV